MKFKDKTAEESWAKIKAKSEASPYSMTCVRFAEKWAERMEEAMRNGDSIQQCAKPLSYKINEEFNLSLAMYHWSLGVLIQVWAHGDALHKAIPE